ncbi:MAG: MarR family transcriptional regulator [Clostridia bacterium]|nr:MarR family transcriptional regulator [Clostridia bacterium]
MIDDPYSALKLENQLCFPLYAAARKIVGLYTPLLKPLGITYTQYLVFLVLWEQDGIAVGELGKKLHLDTGTLTPLLKKMAQDGLIERTRSSIDERVVTVMLTRAGQELREQARDIPRQIAQCVSLPHTDAQDLYRMLYQILHES